MAEFQKVKGFQDIYGDDIAYWKRAEDVLKECFALYSVNEIRIPMLEKTNVFRRGIGETTDVVEKEMFTFDEREGGESLSLRPEGTAGVVRAYIENGMQNPPGLKKYCYLGPMFRRERPQRGRYRQFTQGGVEYLGSAAPMADAEVISLFDFYVKRVGISTLAHLEINSIGCPNCRPQYLQKLVEYFTPLLGGMCPDCNQRLIKNPLRVLDCKSEQCRPAVNNAPLLIDHLCAECDEHFSEMKKCLDLMAVQYIVNPYIVRGLDYYMRTAFEYVTEHLGAASAIGGGGRYDGLFAMLGGPADSGVGFAIGMDRVVELIKMAWPMEPQKADVFIATFPATRDEGIRLLASLRAINIKAEIDVEGRGLKSQMKRADRSGAAYAVILGEDEHSRGRLTVRNLKDSSQEEIYTIGLGDFLLNKLSI